jgi:hypothetical protein
MARENWSTVQYSTVQYSTVQCSTVQYSTVQYSIVQYNVREGSHLPKPHTHEICTNGAHETTRNKKSQVPS